MARTSKAAKKVNRALVDYDYEQRTGSGAIVRTLLPDWYFSGLDRLQCRMDDPKQWRIVMWFSD